MKATSKTALFGGGAVILTALAVGLYVTSANSSSVVPYDKYTPKDEPPGHGVVGNASLDKDSYDITITYTNKGFEPNRLAITQGTRVRFLNKSSESTWPAVGVHPSHTLYPEKESTDCLGSAFDACQDLQPGEFFDFTFYYVGSWPFHDHSHAYQTGTITVTKPASTT